MKEEFYYPSRDKRTRIHAIRWIPDSGPRLILQIAHGMVEFIDRYQEFAEYLNQYGILVTGNDHLGHGKSVRSADDLGYFAAEKGNACVIGDMDRLRLLTQTKYPDVPYILLGHSMGSFLARQYIELRGNALSGAIIMGTGYQTEVTLETGRLLCRIIARARGWRHRSPLLTKIAMGSYNKAFEPVRTPYDWLTKDTKIVDAYSKNPLNTFQFTANAYYNMFKGLSWCQDFRHIDRIPKNLPVLFLSGGNDPVGGFGKGVEKVFHTFQKAGMEDVTMKLYPGDRHEILNELDRKQVYEDVLEWMKKRF